MLAERDRSVKWHRYEVKYLVSEAQATEIGHYCRDHMPPDPYAAYQAGYEYPILSTYLDSPSGALLQQTLLRQVSRYKLRMRTYRRCDQSPDGLPAFFEIKRKINGIVHKTRARLESRQAQPLLWAGQVLFDGTAQCDPATQMNVNEFQQLRCRLGANPVIGVYYRREAYEGNSADRLRITLDRDLQYGLLAPPGNGQRDMWWPANLGSVILEVKFSNTYPFWVADMLRRVEVVRRGVCKYVICSRAAGMSGSRVAPEQSFR